MPFHYHSLRRFSTYELLVTQAAVKGKKALTAGKDIKAQQFEIGLGKEKTRVALGFTKSNELFVGRMAMLGVATSIIGGVPQYCGLPWFHTPFSCSRTLELDKN